MFSSEVLPAPLGPMTETISPRLTSSVTFSTARTPPKRFDTAVAASCGAATATVEPAEVFISIWASLAAYALPLWLIWCGGQSRSATGKVASPIVDEVPLLATCRPTSAWPRSGGNFPAFADPGLDRQRRGRPGAGGRTERAAPIRGRDS